MSVARFRDIPAWVWSLTRFEREVLQALVAAYPRPATDEYLTSGAILREAGDAPQLAHIQVAITYLRRKIPVGGVERVRFVGYRLTPEAAAKL